MTVFRPRSQAEFHRIEAAVLDDSDLPQTVEVAPAREISRDVLVSWDVDPSVEDPRAELEGRLLLQGSRLHPKSFVNPPVYCSRVPGGCVATRAGLVLTDGGDWLVESVGKAHLVGRFAAADGKQRITVEEPQRRLDEDVAVVFAEFSSKKPANYWHWTTEGLARAVALETARVPDTVRVLLPGPVLGFQRESLAAMGISEERILEWDGVPTRFRTVYLVTLPARGGLEPLAVSIELMRGRVARQPEAERRLWVSREGVRRRSGLLDEDALSAAAAELGFEAVQPQTLRVREQAALFARAQAVAGPVGAGLTNAVFMRAGTKVGEVSPPGLEPHGKVVIWNLAAAGEQGYGFYVGTREVDTGRFQHMLSELLSTDIVEENGVRRRVRREQPLVG